MAKKKEKFDIQEKVLEETKKLQEEKVIEKETVKNRGEREHSITLEESAINFAKDQEENNETFKEVLEETPPLPIDGTKYIKELKLVDTQLGLSAVNRKCVYMNKVFLGGTCNNSTWRADLIKGLDCNYFNPVVKDWTPECQEEEKRQKNNECNIHLYVITREMMGVFSIAEAVQSSNTNNVITIFTVIQEGFDKAQIKSLTATSDLIQSNGGYIFDNLDDTRAFLNSGV